jgi:hypothetical protein
MAHLSEKRSLFNTNILTVKHKWFTGLLFAVYLIAGLFILDDYGVSWDEPLQRNHGLVSMDYVNSVFDGKLFDGKLAEHEWNDYPFKDHGVFYQLISLGLEKALGLEEIREIFLLRHLLSFLLFVTGAFFLFLLVYQRWNKYWLAVFAFLLYISFPRVFAHGFYNPKDTIALSWFCINLYTLFRFLNRKTYASAITHALLNAMMMNSRIFGVLVVLVTLAVLFWDQLKPSLKIKNNKLIIVSLLYVSCFIAFTILPWPNLWFDPFENVFQGLKRASKWHWEGYVLLNGNWIKATNLPPWYAPFWMLITLPLSHLVLILAGISIAAFSIIRNAKYFFYRDAVDRMDAAVLALIVLPLVGVIYKESVMYDGWRHLYFLYAAMIYLAVLAWVKWSSLMSRSYRKWYVISAVVIGLYMSRVFYQMVDNHPYQYTYFNELVKRPAIEKFEMDYWGVSYKQAYKELYHRFPEDTFLCVSRYDPAWYNYMSLKPKYRERIKFKDEREGILPKHYYYISIFRFEYELNSYLENRHPSQNPVMIIEAFGNPIIGVFEVDNR